MKHSLIRFGVALAVEAVVFVGAVWWRDEIYSGWAIGQVLFWPAIELARLGLHRTWPVLPLLALLLPVIAVFGGRKRGLGVVALGAAWGRGTPAGWRTSFPSETPISLGQRTRPPLPLPMAMAMRRRPRAQS